MTIPKGVNIFHFTMFCASGNGNSQHVTYIIGDNDEFVESVTVVTQKRNI